MFSRPSSTGPMSHQSFFQQTPMPAGVPRDPRPLKDRSYQTKIGQELLDYLTQNNFELEMKHSLGQNTMKSPTQKDFNYIFQWLYHRIDPAYRFLKNIDSEVPPILKQLRYPYEKSITKSQIAAVGGQNWSTFLGMLHWMMQLAQMLDKYDLGHYDEACAEAGVDISGDRIIFRFLSGAYRDWLQVGEDDDDEDADKLLVPHVEAMAAEFERGNKKYAEEMTLLEAEHKALQTQVEELEKAAPDVAKLDKHFKILEDDKRKFEEYNANVEGKVEKYENRIKFLLEELEKTEDELSEAEKEKASLQEAVDKSGITVQDIDRMNTERERLQKGVEATALKLEEVKRKVAEKEAEASRKLEELERVVEKYNSLGYEIGLIPSTAVNAKGQEYELHLNITEGPNFSASQVGASQRGESDRLLADTATGYHPQHLLNLDLRGAVKSSLLSLRKEIKERRIAASDADQKNHELLDNIKEAIDDKRSEVEALEHKVRAAEEEFEKTKEVKLSFSQRHTKHHCDSWHADQSDHNTGNNDPKTRLRRANREDGKGTGEDARRLDRERATDGAARNEHQHRVSMPFPLLPPPLPCPPTTKPQLYTYNPNGNGSLDTSNSPSAPTPSARNSTPRSSACSTTSSSSRCISRKVWKTTRGLSLRRWSRSWVAMGRAKK